MSKIDELGAILNETVSMVWGWGAIVSTAGSFWATTIREVLAGIGFGFVSAVISILFYRRARIIRGAQNP